MSKVVKARKRSLFSIKKRDYDDNKKYIFDFDSLSLIQELKGDKKVEALLGGLNDYRESLLVESLYATEQYTRGQITKEQMEAYQIRVMSEYKLLGSIVNMYDLISQEIQEREQHG